MESSRYLQKFVREKQIANYIQNQNLTDSMDALIAGLIIIRPKNPLDWCISSLNTLSDMPNYSITWDCLIPIEHRPKSRTNLKALGYLDEIFRLGHQSDIPDPKMFEKAYNFYYKQLKTKAWKAWINFRQYKVKKRKLLAENIDEARKFYQNRQLTLMIKNWHSWTLKRKEAYVLAEVKLKHVLNGYFQHSILENWLEAARESKTTRIYFEQLEKGEAGSLNDEELQQLGIELQKDPISMLDRKLALKIFSHLNLVDLATCSQVCRSWKLLTSSPSLQSQLDFYRVRHKFQQADEAVTTILNKNRAYVIHLNLEGQNNLKPSTLKTIGQCKNLQDLNLKECYGVTDSVIAFVLVGCIGGGVLGKKCALVYFYYRIQRFYNQR